MRFSPVSEEEAADVWPKGEYDALVTSAVEKVSKSSGNDMIELTLTVYGEGGAEKQVRDYLVASDGGQAKIQRFCKSAAIWDLYESGELTAFSCKDANVRVKLATDSKNDDYPPKNIVRDYIPRSSDPAKTTTSQPDKLQGVPANKQVQSRPDMTKPPTDDEIPF